MPVVRLWRRTDPAASAAAGQRWEFEVRPRRAVRTAWIVAVLILAVFTVGGVFLRNGSTGVHFRLADQIAMIVVGALVAGGVLLLTRPRVRAGAEGVAVRNVLGENLFGWEHIRGVSFPDRKSWARLELVDDDYVPLLAIRSNDKEHAARAMERLRELGGRYAPETPHPPR
ncbi:MULTISPECIES: PH domain-containing protein [Nocardia]|uniref:Low molecular weight protein antigen 6 PH domain-containing protein n=2 Tax=Nocardia farcinica TaxID=37329 RepID=Q5YTP5_NOCFA|nr:MULTISPECIES: PH domain-containing protein [Nocardia]AXK89017.1 PH domain-containing protein [Nocardia farcinica]MBA4856198.1 PH domain-containing protein [Nocardia farcinica]MBC9816405.1 PH domain-containing protein [Nocardia farcinica]MBF6068669.1 PH domain-containing protein [Nocardia farcinica]MBF6142128.1 PH domain-containing protein [Nocardia farcinica]